MSGNCHVADAQILLCEKHKHATLIDIYDIPQYRPSLSIVGALELYCKTCGVYICSKHREQHKCTRCNNFYCLHDFNEKNNVCKYCTNVLIELDKLLINDLSKIIIKYI